MKMRRFTVFALYIGVVALLGLPSLAWAQTATLSQGRPETGDPPPNELENLTAWLRELTVELKTLRLELLEQRLENQELKMTQLERELQRVQAQRRWLEVEEGAFSQGLDELQLDDSMLVEAERAERKAAKADLPRSGRERLPTDQQAITEREAALMERLEREHPRRQELTKEIKRLRAEIGHLR
jgi:TolA-binding protein